MHSGRATLVNGAPPAMALFRVGASRAGIVRMVVNFPGLVRLVASFTESAQR
jgi:hypothetical protein